MTAAERQALEDSIAVAEIARQTDVALPDVFRVLSALGEMRAEQVVRLTGSVRDASDAKKVIAINRATRRGDR